MLVANRSGSRGWRQAGAANARVQNLLLATRLQQGQA
jgi:hypothetical protein